MVFVCATTTVHSHLSSRRVQTICILKQYNLKKEVQNINPNFRFSNIMLPTALDDAFSSV